MQQQTPTQDGALSHLTVLDFTHHIAGPLCTKLLADYGAQVIKVERPGTGDPARNFGPFPGDTPDPEKSGTFLYLNTNKSGITLDLKSSTGVKQAKELASHADIVVENFRPGVLQRMGLGYEDLRKENPRLVMVSISNFGQTGPYRDFLASDIVAQAMGGLMCITGLNQREPLKEALSQAQNWAGAMAAAAALTSVAAVRVTGQGAHVDVSIMECVASGLQSTLVWYSYMGAERRRQERALGGLNFIFPCKDGYVVPMAGGSTWEVFANLLGAPELHEKRFATHQERLKHAEELNQVLGEQFQKNGKHELFHRGQEWGFPFGLVQTPEDLVNCPQLAARGFWANVTHPVAGKLRFPGHPFNMSESPWQIRNPAPLLGQHNGKVSFNPRTNAQTSVASPIRKPTGAEERLPLEGIRILEVARHLATPLGTRFLADMGAEVIKIEATTHLEPGRTMYYPDDTVGERFWNQGGYYHEANRNKLHLSLDLSKDVGREVLLELVKTSDVVAENYTPRVMHNLGLSYETLREVRPDVIMLSNTGYGHDGPWKNYKAFGMTLEPTSGQSHFTGYIDGPPMRSTFAYTDSPVAMLNAFAILAAIEYRSRTGKGQWIDLAMYEAGAALLTEGVMDYVLNGRTGGRMGNRDPLYAPQGCYRCSGRDRWLALTVENDQQWVALCNAMGKPELARDPRFTDVGARRKHHSEADSIINEWTGTRDHYELMHLLQAVGIPAGPVLNNKEMLTDPHLIQRGFLEWVEHPPEQEGMGRRLYPGMAWKVSGSASRIRSPAPDLGQDNHKVLTQLVGLSDSRLRELEEIGIIGDRPVYEERPVIRGTHELAVNSSIWPPDSDYRELLEERFESNANS